ncbi:MAG: hypothetical protein HOP12_13290 [Candidatus Eisenbacteria bacterium]|uniref:PEP-CTERM sorting domain-containing protein n=1 Tax=Eiseniibacteriota bacterium TaxID=2212470 RepID=A0A849SKJ8_UNCEI|nr:hypothetical protein [Candidatus Eisenbacteria bacterium]
MKRLATLVVLAVACLLAPTHAHAQLLLFDYVGFDYEDPDLTPSVFGAPGDGYVGIGEVPVLSAPLSSNPALNQYTYVITGLIATAQNTVGPFVVTSYTSPGTLTIYEDPISTGTAFDYGVTPPNASAPSSFNDGTAILIGELRNFTFIFNTATNSGSYEAEYEVVGGSQYVAIPANQRSGWTFSGVTRNTTSIPSGYAHQADGQTFLDAPTPAQNRSWGSLKRSYR